MALRDETAFLDATAQAAMVRRGEVTAAELVGAAAERIERANPVLNAVVRPMFDEARLQVEAGVEGPFAGVPFLLKDLLAAYAGVPTTAGCAFARDFVPPVDSELVARLKRAGFVCVGKTNTPELGI